MRIIREMSGMNLQGLFAKHCVWIELDNDNLLFVQKKQDQQHISPVDDNTPEAVVPDYCNVGFWLLLCSTQFCKSIFSRLQEDDEISTTNHQAYQSVNCTMWRKRC